MVRFGEKDLAKESFNDLKNLQKLGMLMLIIWLSQN